MPEAGRKYLAAQTPPPQPPLDFVVRPRLGNKFYMMQQQQREPVQLSSILARLDNPTTQANALELLGIRLLSRSKVRLDLQELPPCYTPQQQSESRCLELRDTFTMRNPVQQPIGIHVSYLSEAYIEADTAFCCLLEATSPYGGSNSVPVLGRGSFSYLGEESGNKAAQCEHCISGNSAGFLQRAAVSLTVLLCLCELSREDEKAVTDFYRQADRIFGYGFGAYLDYLIYCCQTKSKNRDTYLKYLCLELNNRFTQEQMTQALTHFMNTKQPTERFYDQIRTVMTSEELEKDRESHFSVKGKAAKASMYIKNASRQGQLVCCPCHVM